LAGGVDTTWKDQRVATRAWKDTKEEAQLETLRAALTAISAAEFELEEIRRQDELHVREQERELRERREQAERLEQAELQIRELVASSGAPLLRSRDKCDSNVPPCVCADRADAWPGHRLETSGRRGPDRKVA
jgi:hypothetical protein